MNSGNSRSALCWTLTFAMLVAVGCEQGASPTAANPAKGSEQHPEHDHSQVGPHGGDLIEFGSDVLHAELVHPAEGPVAVHLLAGDARTAKPVAGADVRINLSAGGTARQFRLVAKADPTDPAGTASRFVGTEPELGKLLEEPENKPTLVVSFDGQQFRAAIRHGDHSHVHDGH